MPLNKLQRDKLNKQIDNIRKVRDSIRELPASIRLKYTNMERHLEKELDDRVGELALDARLRKSREVFRLEVKVDGGDKVRIRRFISNFQPTKADLRDVVRHVRAEGGEPLSYEITKTQILESGNLL